MKRIKAKVGWQIQTSDNTFKVEKFGKRWMLFHHIKKKWILLGLASTIRKHEEFISEIFGG